MVKTQIEGGITYKKQKGFTLIELLAVIVILAVIALILTPIVSGIIKTAKKNAFESTGYGILESTKLYYSKKVGDLETDLTFTCNNDTCESGEEKLEFKGNINGSGTVLLFRDGNIALCLESEDYATIKNINDERLSTTEQGTCEFNEETKEYAVIGTVSAKLFEELQNQYTVLNNTYMNGKNTLVNTLNNKGIETSEDATLEEMASNIEDLPTTFVKDAEGNYGYIGEDGSFNSFESKKPNDITLSFVLVFNKRNGNSGDNGQTGSYATIPTYGYSKAMTIAINHTISYDSSGGYYSASANPAGLLYQNREVDISNLNSIFIKGVGSASDGTSITTWTIKLYN